MSLHSVAWISGSRGGGLSPHSQRVPPDLSGPCSLTHCQLSQSCSEGSFSARNTLHLFHPLFYWHPTHPSYLTVNFTPLKWTSPSLTLRPDESPITASNNALGLSLKHLLLASYSIICIHLMSTLPLRQEGRPVSLSGSPLYLQYPAQHMAYDGCSAKIC